MTEQADLHAPVLLIAMPQVGDPFFQKSVVLLLQHDDESSFGFILNRPTGVEVQEILEGMDLPGEGLGDAEAFIGGPVQPQLGSVLFGHPPQPGEPLGVACVEVLPGVWLTQHVGDLQRLVDEPPERLRLYLGYAAWGEGQLVEEILRNDWILAPVDPELVFNEDADAVWEQAVRSVGIDPAALPSWTGSGDGSTN